MKKAIWIGVGLFALLLVALAIALWVAGDGSIPMNYDGF